MELDTAVALGITPVGAAAPANVNSMPNYLEVEGIELVGTVTEPDLEAIAALQPDLILGTEARHADLYEQLDDIAPTVFMQTQADPWQQNVLLIGDALNQRDAAQKVLDGYNRRCGEIREKFNVAGETANLLRPLEAGELRIYSPTSFAGSALECVGLTVPEQKWDGDGGVGYEISTENLIEAKADYIFVTTKDVSDPSTIPAGLAADPVAFPSVTPVDTNYWLSGVGPKGGGLVLDDIERFLLAR